MRNLALLLAMVTLMGLLTASGVAAAAVINGTNKADRIDGRGGNDTGRGLRGNDKITGGLGNDTLGGASGSDRYVFGDGWGQDLIGAESGGIDILDFSATGGNLNVSLVPTAGTSEASSGTNTLNITNTELIIENVRGGTGRNNITSNDANNALSGNADIDALFGYGGNDSLSGGASTDDLYGDTGNDTMNGGDGNDAYHFEADDWANDATAPGRRLRVRARLR